MPRTRRTSPLPLAWIVTGALVLAACEASPPTDPAPGARFDRGPGGGGALKDAALFAGNFQPGGMANGVLRFDGRGHFVDRMVPEGYAGLTIGCCLTFGPDENLYVGSPLEGKLLRFHGVTGEFIDEFIGAGEGLDLTLIPLFHDDGRLYVGDIGNGGIHRYDAKTGAYLGRFVDTRAQGTLFGDPQFFEFGADGNLYVASVTTSRVLRYDGSTGAFIDEFVPRGPDGIGDPSGLTFGPDGLLYVGGGVKGEVRRYDIGTGRLVDVFVSPGSGGLTGPVGIQFGPDGNLYVADAGTGAVLRYDGRTGRFMDAFVPAGTGGIDGPRAIVWKSTLTVCHKPGAGNARTLTIGYLSGFDHVAHGDALGRCGA